MFACVSLFLECFVKLLYLTVKHKELKLFGMNYWFFILYTNHFFLYLVLWKLHHCRLKSILWDDVILLLLPPLAWLKSCLWQQVCCVDAVSIVNSIFSAPDIRSHSWWHCPGHCITLFFFSPPLLATSPTTINQQPIMQLLLSSSKDIFCWNLFIALRKSKWVIIWAYWKLKTAWHILAQQMAEPVAYKNINIYNEWAST